MQLITELMLDLANVLSKHGDIPVMVRHFHQSFAIAADSMAIKRDENGKVQYVSIAIHTLPVELT